MENAHTLSEEEVRRVLAATRTDAPREHVAFALALGAGLRLGELCALNVGDVRNADGSVRWQVRLPHSKRRRSYDGEVVLSQRTARRLARWLRTKRQRGEPMTDASPLLVTTRGPRNSGELGEIASSPWKRLGRRGLEYAWSRCQARLGLVDGRGAPRYTFHNLRATAITASLRQTDNLEKTRRFARHADARTTQRYLNLSPEDVRGASPDY